MNSRRAYCFTINNPESLLDFEDCPIVRYAVYQEEIGLEGTNHFQGYLELSTPRRLNYIKRNIPGFETAHLEVRNGTRDEARDYAMKKESRIDGPYEYGTFESGGRGKRTDIAALKKIVDEGATESEIWDAYPGMYLRHRINILSAMRLKTVQRSWKTWVTLITGPPGTGKTSLCRLLTQDRTTYWKNMSNWWDGYNSQTDVILDDFTGWIPWTTLMHLMDRYPLMVEIKGGTVCFLARRIWLTSNTEPQCWYQTKFSPTGTPIRTYPLEALERRVDSWVRLEQNNWIREFRTAQDYYQGINEI